MWEEKILMGCRIEKEKKSKKSKRRGMTEGCRKTGTQKKGGLGHTHIGRVETKRQGWEARQHDRDR